jgi:hypothetical protein
MLHIHQVTTDGVTGPSEARVHNYASSININKLKLPMMLPYKWLLLILLDVADS